eukprot:12696271-Alexandrium_andersonii.AAC.1
MPDSPYTTKKASLWLCAHLMPLHIVPPVSRPRTMPVRLTPELVQRKGWRESEGGQGRQLQPWRTVSTRC